MALMSAGQLPVTSIHCVQLETFLSATSPGTQATWPHVCGLRMQLGVDTIWREISVKYSPYSEGETIKWTGIAAFSFISIHRCLMSKDAARQRDVVACRLVVRIRKRIVITSSPKKQNMTPAPLDLNWWLKLPAGWLLATTPLKRWWVLWESRRLWDIAGEGGSLVVAMHRQHGFSLYLFIARATVCRGFVSTLCETHSHKTFLGKFNEIETCTHIQPRQPERIFTEGSTCTWSIILLDMQLCAWWPCIAALNHHACNRPR